MCHANQYVDGVTCVQIINYYIYMLATDYDNDLVNTRTCDYTRNNMHNIPQKYMQIGLGELMHLELWKQTEVSTSVS